MTTMTLKRCDLATGDDDAFAREVSAALGYRHLALEMTGTALVECFRKVGIRPFDNNDVGKYKAEMLKRMNRRNNQLRKIIIASLIAATTLIVAISAIAVGNACVLFFLIVAIPIEIIIVTVIFEEAAQPWRWQSVYLRNYSKPVPRYALELAMQLRNELSRANIAHEFYIDELSLRERLADPFLLVAVGNKIYYLEVWDEPDFGAKRTV